MAEPSGLTFLVLTERQAAALEKLSTGQLCDRYAELFGETTRTRHRTYLVRKIIWKLQARAEGDLTERARRRAAELASGAELRVMAPKSKVTTAEAETVVHATIPSDSRLQSPGAAIVRQYKGRKLQVVVLPDGFEFDGERYKSLSAVAKKITGSHVNGYRFFELEGKR